MDCCVSLMPSLTHRTRYTFQVRNQESGSVFVSDRQRAICVCVSSLCYLRTARDLVCLCVRMCVDVSRGICVCACI